MPKSTITNQLIRCLKPASKPYEIRDKGLSGFILRVYSSEKMAFVVQLDRGKRKTIGRVGIISIAEARKVARQLLSERSCSIEEKSESKKTVGEFLKKDYGPWVKGHIKSGDESVKSIVRHFNEFFELPLSSINTKIVETWRIQKLNIGNMKPNSINRVITCLRSLMSKAVEWNEIETHDLSKLRNLKYDDTRVRYLTGDEKTALLNALINREERYRWERQHANQWRKERGHVLYPERPEDAYVDYLRPMILIALNTGLRKSELFRLKRSDIYLSESYLHISESKNYTSRNIPLNETAKNVLEKWLKQTEGVNSCYLFPSVKNSSKPITTVKKAWENIKKEAQLENFRWHDLRHTFASDLVMSGVLLQVVQQLLGHKSIEQTMRYAHLSPDYLANSVTKLDEIAIKY